jgi:hypothetical protein
MNCGALANWPTGAFLRLISVRTRVYRENPTGIDVKAFPRLAHHVARRTWHRAMKKMFIVVLGLLALITVAWVAVLVLGAHHLLVSTF